MTSPTTFPLLEQISSPADLKLLTEDNLKVLAEECREFLIHSVGQTGGHLAANLGTVELTIALHYILNSPTDNIVWDVGHQSYVHKMLTGRREAMHSIRKQQGLSGFPRREESPYDCFGTGHSSTSISAALGMAIGAKLQDKATKSVAVIGDGAMTAGMAFEALNHAGDLDANLLVVLNDNDMSISPNVGGLSNYLARILSGKLYSGVRAGSKKVLSKMPSVWELARRAEEHVKGMVIPGTLFEELGFNYIGPIDGHDLDTLIPTIRNLIDMQGPQFLHVVTKKGKGYAPAEDNPCAFHGVSAFDPKTGKPHQSSSSISYTQVFGDWLCDIAAAEPSVVGITPAMREGSGLVAFSQQFPERYFDVGIAEQHSVTLAAGMACAGQRPVVAIYSTFLQRAYDQLIHDVALQNLPVLFAIDRAGVVGPDGATHAGSFDLSYLRCIPNMVVMTPANERECRQMLTTGIRHDGPAAVRYPRGSGPGVSTQPTLETLPLGKAQLTRQGEDVALLAFGCVHAEAMKAAESLHASVVNMRFVKPLDTQIIEEIAKNHAVIITLEDNVVSGGAGSGVAEYLAEQQIDTPVYHLGLPDEFLEHAERNTLLSAAGLDSSGILRAVTALLASRKIGSRQHKVS